MSELVERPIPAKALIPGLRAVGYSFPTAVADIIDNSISAKATKIQVYSDPLPSTKVPYFCILDNGCGMTYDELDNAMLFGSDRSQKTDSDIELGRFGLGLKTASLSQCTRFTVATKKEGCFNAFAFDLENVERTNKIQLCKLNSDEIDDRVNYLKIIPLTTIACATPSSGIILTELKCLQEILKIPFVML